MAKKPSKKKAAKKESKCSNPAAELRKKRLLLKHTKEVS